MIRFACSSPLTSRILHSGLRFRTRECYETPDVRTTCQKINTRLRTKCPRDYLAMTLALDDMVGDLLDYLDKTGKDKNTLVIFTSDHGTTPRNSSSAQLLALPGIA